jgi:hypothetical protein
MGGINPCIAVPHKAAGAHGERLTESLLGSFVGFLEAHRSIERAIISEGNQNAVAAIAHAQEAQKQLTHSFDLLQDAKLHIASYERDTVSTDAFTRAISTLDATEMRSLYISKNVLSGDPALWDQISHATISNGMSSGFKLMSEWLADLEKYTFKAMELMEYVIERSRKLSLEPSIRANELPFIQVNNRLLTQWIKVISAYQQICLISLEGYAAAQKSNRPVQ